MPALLADTSQKCIEYNLLQSAADAVVPDCSTALSFPSHSQTIDFSSQVAIAVGEVISLPALGARYSISKCRMIANFVIKCPECKVWERMHQDRQLPDAGKCNTGIIDRRSD